MAQNEAPDPKSDPQTGRKGGRNGEPVVIKKYANRRLYNTDSSAYVTLDHLSEMVREGVDFVVYDAKTNEDITRGVLAQIIFEEEGRGQNLLPLPFLRQLIRFYGDSMQSFLPAYLEMSLDGFIKQQDKMREEFSGKLGGADAFEALQAQARQNMAMFDRTMRMFTPFGFPLAGGEAEATKTSAENPKPAEDPKDPMAEMRAQMEAMQRQIADLAGKK